MTDQPPPCSSPEASQFDFWVGEWDLSWPADQTGGESGGTATGTNRIQHRFGNCVIEENFSSTDGSFLGHSVSVYDPDAGVWKQTWVDNVGGYLLFEGGMKDGFMELRTPVVEQDGEQVVQRMVFTEVTDDSLVWRWQGSRDGGNSWNDLWTISYFRRD